MHMVNCQCLDVRWVSQVIRSCKVTVQDMNGVSHTVEVTAATLYEAVALGLATVRSDEWATGIAEGLNCVTAKPRWPIQTGRVDSFDRRLREQCLNVSWFGNPFKARALHLIAGHRIIHGCRDHASKCNPRTVS